MEVHPTTPPHSHSWKLRDIPLNPAAFTESVAPSSQPFIVRSSSFCHPKLAPRLTDSTKSTIDSVERIVQLDKASFRIRPATPKINLTKKKAGALVDIFQNFEGFIRNMIEKGEDVESEADLYLKLLSEYLSEDVEEIRQFKKIEIIVDTTNLTLQALGDTLKELVELKLNGSIIKSIRDVGTSYKSLKILWVSRVGLKDLSGLLAFQSLEELYASYNFVSDISDIEYVEKLHTLDLEANNISDVRQLTYVSSALKNVTFTGNKVTEDPEYLKTLLKYGTSLETVDDIDVKNIRKDIEADPSMTINSPVKVVKKEAYEFVTTDDKLIERFKMLGLSEDAVRESIQMADDLLGNEPTQDEILRQSIRIGNKGCGLKVSILTPKVSTEIHGRPATASLADGRYRGSTNAKPQMELYEVEEEQAENEPKVIEGYSELVSNTETVFAGNPLKAAKHKKMKGGDKAKVMDIYELIDQFKGASVSLKNEINKKMRVTPIPEPTTTKSIKEEKPVIEKVMPELKGPIKPRGIINIKKIRYIKK